ncbi:4-alpha-glucanotransferase [Streptomyces sp. NPDC004647]|uniref:4-alpha-glucanotransferase n=1 Tax=Streptomyces sp. NPDC004647 TaxID=3154671 RepID=UPI0033B13D1C
MGRARLAALRGVATSYEPSPGHRADVPEDTVVAVLAALGVDASTPQAVRAALGAHRHDAANRLLPATVVLRVAAAAPSARARDAASSTAPRHPPAPAAALPEGTVLYVETEQGESLPWDGSAFFRGNARGASALGTGAAAAGQLPLGTYVLRAHTPDGRSARAALIVTPDRMPAPRGRTFGFLVQLYSLLSARSWGMGDLGDLADLAAWSGRSLGAGFVQLNPLHAAVPGDGSAPTDPSPYRPSSRRFPDPVHLRVEDVPEYAHLTGPARERAAELLHRAAGLRDSVLNKGALIDRDAVWRLKREALELVRAVPLSPGRRAAYCDFLAEQGQALDDHATWCAFAEVHGPDWHTWPSGLRDPRSARTERARSALLDRVDFHCRLAWLTDGQLADAQRTARDAGMGIGMVHDLAVGVHPGGADAWAQQDAFAAGMSVGAPPDAFNSRGQDWGLPPWRPDTLAASGHAPYRDLLRGLLRHAGALRIDHVMGLFRLWWVPEGCEPTQGTYVRYDAEAMLGVLALEAHRAGAVVIGEDLGTVEPGVRDALAGRGVLGTSVLWFERDYDGLLADPEAVVPEGATEPDNPGDETRDATRDGAPADETTGDAAGGDAATGDAGDATTGDTATRDSAAGDAATFDAAPRDARNDAMRDTDTRAATGDARDAGDAGDAGDEATRDAAAGHPATGDPTTGDPDTVDAGDAAAEAAGNAGESTRAVHVRRARPLPPEAWRADCLATATTHDLPSTAARLTGEHVELRHRLGLLTRPLAQEQAEDAVEVGEWLRLLRRRGLLPEGVEDEEGAIKAVYRFLARTPARMVGVWLPDGVGDRRPQNLPGTWKEYPNWRLPIAGADGQPVTLEQLAASPRLHSLMAELAELIPAEPAPEAAPRSAPEPTPGAAVRSAARIRP